MKIAIGIAVIVAGLICWIGQLLSLFAPAAANKLGVCEAEGEMDPVLFLIETKANGLTNVVLTWMLPLSALLMILDVSGWPILALIGGGIYLYFPGLVILNRIFLKRHGRNIGKASSEYTAYVLGFIWVISAIAMITLAIREISA
ncbi:MAG: hypothetical protein F6J95_030140 [Leptolyngbya sp. SIO1E4]|nr:hypothetical protein [Leptolyngbya sp. SIO1E4]